MKVSIFIHLAIGAALLPITTLLSDMFITNFELLFVIGVLTIMDAITGITYAFREKQAKSAIFFDKFIVKYVIYSAAIITTAMIFVLTQKVDKYHLPFEMAEMILTYPMYVIISKEVWSIFENIGKLSPGFGNKLKSIFKKIIK